eukprot:1043741-Prymnesium_polylepis.1
MDMRVRVDVRIDNRPGNGSQLMDGCASRPRQVPQHLSQHPDALMPPVQVDFRWLNFVSIVGLLYMIVFGVSASTRLRTSFVKRTL